MCLLEFACRLQVDSGETANTAAKNGRLLRAISQVGVVAAEQTGCQRFSSRVFREISVDVVAVLVAAGAATAALQMLKASRPCVWNMLVD